MTTLSESHHPEVKIPRVEDVCGITYYTVHVSLNNTEWTVDHRYSAFLELHQLLVSNHGIARDLLPPKKLIGNKEPLFIEKRRVDLQLYLQTIVNFMPHSLPRELAEFLHLQYYETTFLLQALARRCFHNEEHLLARHDPVVFTPLEIMAISLRLKSPLPTNVASEQESDFSHVVDFASKVSNLVIEGGKDGYRQSNIILNQLEYSLSCFKNIGKLEIRNANVTQITHLGSVRSTTHYLIVKNSCMAKVADMFLCDSVHRDNLEGGASNMWENLTDVDFSDNEIQEIDPSIRLAPNIERLNLSGNRLMSIDNLTSLPHLTSLNLSNNLFCEIGDLNLKLGKVHDIDMSQNNISSLKCLSKLYSIVSLNLASNNICAVKEVNHIGGLPCIESLVLTGNPVATVVDYRTRTLELFGPHASEVCLDNEKPTQRELDKVAVLQAIRTAKEGRVPPLNVANPIPSLAAVPFAPTDVAFVASESLSSDK